MTRVRIPAPQGIGTARLLVRLVSAGRPVLGFVAADLHGEYVEAALDEDQVLELVPTTAIALATGAATYYEIVIRTLAGHESWLVQVPETDAVCELRDLVGAAAIDPEAITAHLWLAYTVPIVRLATNLIRTQAALAAHVMACPCR